MTDWWTRIDPEIAELADWLNEAREQREKDRAIPVEGFVDDDDGWCDATAYPYSSVISVAPCSCGNPQPEVTIRRKHQHGGVRYEVFCTKCGMNAYAYSVEELHKGWDYLKLKEEKMAVPRGEGVDHVRVEVKDPSAPWKAYTETRWVYDDKHEDDDDSVDNWVHRSDNMRCRTCMFYVPKLTLEDLNHGPLIGRCRRHAPTMSGFPVVYQSDWCGDHKVDEEKI